MDHLPADADGSVDAALARLASSFDRHLDDERVREALGDPGSEAPLRRIERGLLRVGLSATQVAISPATLLKEGSRACRYVAELPGGDGLLLVAFEAGRLRGEHLRGDGHAIGHHLDAESMAGTLGLPKATATFPCLVVEEPEDVAAEPGKAPTVREALRLWLGPDRSDLLAVVIYAAAVGLFGLVTPLTVQALVTSVAFGTLLQPIFVLGVIVVAFLSSTAFLRVMQAWVAELLQRKMFVRAASVLTQRLVHLDRAASEEGASVARAATRFLEVSNAQKALAALFLDGLEAALTALVGLTVLAFYHPLLLALDVALLAGLYVVIVGLGKGGVETSIAESNAKYGLVDWFHALAERQSSLTGRGGAAFARKKSEGSLREWLVARAAHFRVVQRQRVGAVTLQVVASAGLLVVGGILVVENRLTMGQLVAAELIVTAVASAAAKLGKHAESYYDLVTAVKKLTAIAAIPVHVGEGDLRGTAVGPAKAELTCDGAAGDDAWTRTLAPGDAVLIRADDDSPAAELLRAIGAPHAARIGAVRIDDEDLTQMDRDVAAARVAYVRDVALFPGRIADNVRFGRPELSRRDVEAALDRAAVRDALLARGLDLTSEVRPSFPRDARVRTGIAVARALAGKPGLLVLDGALDALAPDEAEAMIARIVEGEPRMTLIVRSRMALDVAGVGRVASLPRTPTEGVPS